MPDSVPMTEICLKGAWAALTLLALGISVYFWRRCTVPFLRDNGEDARPFNYATYWVYIFFDLYFAWAIALSYGRKLPVGTKLHAMSLISVIVVTTFLIRSDCGT